MTMPLEAMSTPDPHSFEPVPLVLARKLILLGLLMIVAALGLVLLLRHVQIYSLIFPHILSDAVMGLIAGLSARVVLRNQTVFLRIAAILAFLVGSLELLGWFTGWQIGLGPLKIGLSRVDWYSLGQLLLSSGVSLLALYAWTQPILPAAVPAQAPQSIKRSPRPRPQLERRSRRTQAQARSNAPAGVEQPAEIKPRAPAQLKPQLLLSEVEEHRCPYCLELIEPNDPRGTVECKICHTLHHADCWAITGACQVPHFTV
jgi:hypothetical protein